MEPRFAELLVKGGVVTREQLTEAQKKERENASSLIKEVVRLGYSSEETLSAFLAKQFGIETGICLSPAADNSEASVGPL